MINKICIKLIKFYKKYLTSAIKSNCIFEPTCSQYALEAYKKHNFFKASFLTLWRLLRCNSLNKGGFDPVPDNYNTKK